jgi:multidrug efflux pump subunit AcrB
LRAALASLVALAACGGDSGPGGVVTVQVTYPGASPEDVEHAVLEPLEVAVNRVDGVYGLRGRAGEGVARLDITFRRGTDTSRARTAVQDAVTAMQGALPGEAEPPFISVKPAAWVMARIPDQPKLFETLFAQIGTLPVTWVEQCGVREARLSLEVVPAKLRAHGLTIADVASAIREQNAQVPAGRVDAAGSQVRVLGEVSSYDEIANIVVTSHGAGDATGLRVRDFAVITQRSEATCLVDGPIDKVKPALLRVGVRHAKDVRRLEKELTKLRLEPLTKAITVSHPGRPTRVELVTSPAGTVVEALVFGDDNVALAEKGRNALATLRTAPSVAAAWCQGCERATTYVLHVNRQRAADSGVSVASIAQVIRAVTGGERAAAFQDQGQSFDVVLGVEEGQTRWSELFVRSAKGTLVNAGNLIDASPEAGPADLLRVDRRRAVAVRLRGAPKASAAELKKLVTSALPEARVRTLDPHSVDAEPW